VKVALLQQMFLQPRLDAFAKQRAIRQDDGGAAAIPQQAHDQRQKQVCGFLGAEGRKIVFDAVFLAPAKGRVGEHDIDALILAPGNQRAGERVIVAYEARVLDAMQQHVGDAEHMRQRLLFHSA